MTPLERAALAIFEQCSQDIEALADNPEAVLRAWSKLGGSDREKWMRMASAALQSIREPDERTLPSGNDRGRGLIIWYSMIDSILGQG